MGEQRRAFSASVFARYKGKVLLVQHKLLNLWLPVGGELEAGETPLDAAKRELMEETGLVINIHGHFPDMKNVPEGTPPGFLGYEEHWAGPKGYHMNFCFLAEVVSDNIVSDGSWTSSIWVDPYDSIINELRTPQNVRDILNQLKKEVR